MAKRHNLLAALVLGVLAFAGMARADDVVAGKTIRVSGDTRFTFWSEFLGRYHVLKDGKEGLLLAGASIDAPAGVVVKQVDLRVHRKQTQTQPSPFLRGKQTIYKYEQYVIDGKWDVTVPATWTGDTCTVRIRLPAVAQTRDALRLSKMFVEDQTITLKVNTFRSAEDLARAREARVVVAQGPWWKRVLPYGLLLIPIACAGFILWNLLLLVWHCVRGTGDKPLVPQNMSFEP